MPRLCPQAYWNPPAALKVGLPSEHRVRAATSAVQDFPTSVYMEVHTKILDSADRALALIMEGDPIVGGPRNISRERVYWTLGTFNRPNRGDELQIRLRQPFSGVLSRGLASRTFGAELLLKKIELCILCHAMPDQCDSGTFRDGSC